MRWTLIFLLFTGCTFEQLSPDGFEISAGQTLHDYERITAQWMEGDDRLSNISGGHSNTITATLRWDFGQYKRRRWENANPRKIRLIVDQALQTLLAQKEKIEHPININIPKVDLPKIIVNVPKGPAPVINVPKAEITVNMPKINIPAPVLHIEPSKAKIEVKVAAPKVEIIKQQFKPLPLPKKPDGTIDTRTELQKAIDALDSASWGLIWKIVIIFGSATIFISIVWIARRRIPFLKKYFPLSKDNGK